ncbi:hypothetical protein ACFL4N_08880 [Thermodesulfobacteriota bacterium]
MEDSQAERDRKYEKALLLNRNCTQLRKYKSGKYPHVVAAVDYFYDELLEFYDTAITRQFYIDMLRYHIEFFLNNLLGTYFLDPDRVIVYSRDSHVYSNRTSKYNKHFKLSYRYSIDKGRDGKGVIPFLDEKDYIENFQGFSNRNNPEKSRQSRMRATPKLIDLIESQFPITEDELEVDYSDDELVVLKGVKPKPTKRWVLKDGKEKQEEYQRPRRVVKTPDTPAVRLMKSNLELINEVMETAVIDLDIDEEELKELNARMNEDSDPYKRAVDFSKKRLYRVFLDRRLDRGGRFYGPWYQNVPKEYRPKITIDGAPTMELDYSSLHPYLLYYIAKKKPPADGLYHLDGYGDDTRKFRKAVFLRIINSKSRLAAKGSVRKAAFKLKKLVVPAEFGKLDDKDLDPLIDAYLEKHKALEKVIFEVKDIGNILQYVDSQIAEHVLLYFAEQGIPALPIHDSFRIDARVHPQLEEIMNTVIIQNFGSYIPITNDDLDPLMDRVSGILKEQLEAGNEELESFLKSAVTQLRSNLDKLKEIGKAD